MLAMYTKNPIWIMDEKEAESLASALLDVMSQHSININPATLAYMKLIGIITAMYGPRLYKIQAQKKAEKARTIEMPQ